MDDERASAWPTWREVVVPEGASGLRLDRFLALRFADRSRSWFRQRVRAGEILDDAARPLAASHRVSAGDVVRITTPGIAPDGPPPPFPTILWEDDAIVAIDKPAGLLSHPAGTRFQWGVISLAKLRWPADRVDLVHRLDRDTSGVMLLTRTLDANRALKQAVKEGRVRKEYEALTRGRIPWDRQQLRGPIGPAEGPIRIQMAVRPDGLPARTDVTVVARQDAMTRVHCRLHTGRTHQIRVHLDHAGHSLIGDRLYGVPPELFLDIWEHGVSEARLREAGAPRHALHAARTTFPTPAGEVTVEAPWPQDLARWWADPEADRFSEPAPALHPAAG